MRPVRFFGETLGLEVAFDAGNTVELTAGNGDRIQLFGPGHRSFEFYRRQGDSIVPLLEVDDLDQALSHGPPREIPVPGGLVQPNIRPRVRLSQIDRPVHGHTSTSEVYHSSPWSSSLVAYRQMSCLTGSRCLGGTPGARE